MLRPSVIGWIFWRNVKSYFSGVLGYLIIVAFVTICALLTFSQSFFANNYASLDELSRVYSWLLLFLVPAITMGAWAEEHKSGTDVLLFTLPASTWEILLGKYFAVSAVYVVALSFSVTQLIPLAMLGQPDWSVLVSTYYGYLLSGLALLSMGLFASSLTRDSAVAFVLGMLFCSVPVLSNYFLQGVPYLDLLTIQTQLNQYANGIVTFTGLFYFGGLIALFLYLNHIVISQRFWSRMGKPFMSLNFAVRSVAFLAIVVAGFFMLERLSGRFPAYLDLTSERLYTLDEMTLTSIKNVEESAGQVTIEAYISAEVPADFVPTKKLLETLLSQYERLGGGRVVLQKVTVPDSTSDEATQAEELGIEPINSQSVIGGKSVQQDIFLGAIVRTANGESVLPKFTGRDSIEYEITRAISMLSKKDNRLTLGVLDTDLHFAGLEIQGQIVDLGFGRTKKELEKFYKIRRVNASLLKDYADVLMAETTESVAVTRGLKYRSLAKERLEEIKESKLPDVMLVAGVSSLDEATLKNLIEYIKFGKPVLLLDDPVPFYWPTYVSMGQIGVFRSPGQARISPQANFSALNASQNPKANVEGQLVKNGGFDTENNWTIGSGWKVDGGAAVATSVPVGPAGSLTSSAMVTAGTTYLVSYQVTATSGGVCVSVGGTEGIVRETTGSYREEIVAGLGAGISFVSKGADFTGSIDNVSVKELPLNSLTEALGITWNPTTIVSNTASEPAAFDFPLLEIPMMETSSAWPEGYGDRKRALVFFRNSSQHTNFNPNIPVSGGLRELLFMYSGTLAQDPAKKFQFEPLVSTDSLGSYWDYDQYSENLQLVSRRFDRQLGRRVEEKSDQLNPFSGLPERIFKKNVSGTPGTGASVVAAKINGTESEPRRVIFICDTDFVSDLAYECADNTKTGLDNLILLQNAIESLTEKQGESFIAIRGRRPQPRPLEKIEEVRIQARQQREARQAVLENELEIKLQEAQAKLDEKTKALEEDQDLSFVQRLQLAATAASEEQKQVNREVEKLEKAFRQEIKTLEVNEKKVISSQEHWTRFFAVLLPPLPALAIGISVILVRLTNQANARRKS